MAGSSVIGALRVNLGIDTATFNKGLGSAGKSLAGFGRQMSKIGAGLSVAVTAPLVGIGVAAVKAFQESEAAAAQVAAAIKSTGGAVGFTTDQLADMAAGLQKISTFDDDDIMANVTAQLLRFGTVTGTTFADAQKAIIDFSARTGTDLQSATALIGKALSDPARAIGTLRKAGVQFSADQQAVIASLIKTGDVAGAQAVILDALETKFGGAATAMASTTSGAMAQAQNAWGDAMEAIGGVVAKFIPPIANAIKSVAEWFSTLNPETQTWAVAVAGIAAAAGPALAAIGLMTTGLAGVLGPIALVSKALIGLTIASGPIGLLIAALGVVALAWANWDKIGPIVQAAATMVATAVQAMYEAVKTWLMDKLGAVMDWVVGKIQAVGGAFQWLYDKVVGHSWIPDMVTGVEDWMGRLATTMPALAQDATGGAGAAFEKMGAGIGSIADTIKSDLSSAFDSAVDGTFNLQDAIGGLLKDLAKLVINNAFQSLLGGIFGGLGGGVATGAPMNIMPGIKMPTFAAGGGFRIAG